MSDSPSVKTIPVRTKGEGLVGRAVNAGGVFGAATLMAISLWRATAVNLHDPAYSFSAGRLYDDLMQGSPMALAMAACVILVLTPTLRMLVLAAYLGVQRRFAFALAALAVVAILAAAFILE